MAGFELALHGQDAEVQLLASFLARLESGVVVDVGAERGSVAQVLLEAGATEVHLVEPEPENAATLRERFAGDSRVHVHELAASAEDGELVLRRSTAPTGGVIPFGHTVLERPDTEQIAWRDTVTVPARSLASLSAAGELPERAAIVKIDTEGHDLAVVQGLGNIDCDVVMVEHWSELGDSLGTCPWTSEEMTSTLRERGFGHFAFVLHHGEFSTLRWDDATVGAGEMGNLVFLHDRVVDKLLPEVLGSASTLAAEAAIFAASRAAAADERLAQIEELTAVAEERLVLIDRLKAEVATQAAVNAERLAAIEDIEGDRVGLAKVAAERLAVIAALEREREVLAQAAEERLTVIAALEQERDVHAQAAAARLTALEELEEEAALRLRALEEYRAQRFFST